MLKKPVYMDYHATTPMDPRVRDAMMPCLNDSYGNPASATHALGISAQSLVDTARSQVAALIGAKADEIVFTAGATEASNMAIKGVWEIYGAEGAHIITQVTEHKSVLEVCRFLEKKRGAKVTYLPVDEAGRVSAEEVRAAITDKTILISVMHANNEVGTIQPIREIGRTAKEKNIFFHVDAAQTAGKIPVDVERDGVDLLAISGHKMYAPKGVGALYIRKTNPRVRLEPLIHGGGQEDGRRSGTVNVPGVVGLGKACEIAAAGMNEEMIRITALRDRMQKRLSDELTEIRINGDQENRLPGNLNISFSWVEAEGLMMALGDDVCLSASSACSSGSTNPSYVLKEMKVPKEYIHNAVRFGLGRYTTQEEVDYAADKVIDAVNRLRATSPLYASDEDSAGSEASA